MRTKALLGLAALAASALGASAANVYSLNVVGYINVPIFNGANIIANQLPSDGIGANDTVAGVFSSNLPLGTKVYEWDGAGWNKLTSYAKDKSGNPVWSDTTLKLVPGQAAQVLIPAGTFGAGGSNVTVVGTVPQGSLVNGFMPANAGVFGIVASQVPLSGGLQTVLKYTPTLGDKVYQYFNGGWNKLDSYGKDKSGNPVWSTGSEPLVGLAEGFFLSTGAAGETWTQNFTVQ